MTKGTLTHLFLFASSDLVLPIFVSSCLLLNKPDMKGFELRRDVYLCVYPLYRLSSSFMHADTQDDCYNEYYIVL